VWLHLFIIGLSPLGDALVSSVPMSPYWIFVAGLLALHDSARPSSPSPSTSEIVQVDLGPRTASRLKDNGGPSANTAALLSVNTELSGAPVIAHTGEGWTDITEHRDPHRKNDWENLANFHGVDNGELELEPPTNYKQPNRYFEDLLSLKDELDPEHGTVKKFLDLEEDKGELAKKTFQEWLEQSQYQRQTGNLEWRQAIAHVMDKLKEENGHIKDFIKDKAHKEWTHEQARVKKQEQEIAEFLAKKKDEAKAVLDKMNSATDSGLSEHVMSTWCQYFKDNAQAKKMEQLMAENEARFGALNGRQKDNAKGVMGRVNEQMELNCLLKHFSAWATDTKLERIMRHYNAKMDSKKHQLQSVQHLFKSFANQLDQGLKADADSARDSSSRRRKEDGGVSLPPIQK